ncbi:molybdopterin-dependent oxidoreductase [Nocardia cyriacigeorgica]|uniref:molybdopterin-dependent oxidoreductase n=1 Tax=Nocardia cyriacigeorgica TaxID=135487 RepID=UPI001894D27D|nr:molybdopterin-dependent oxidoreductase [Nocardia cyriacigeorgica]
MHDPNRPAPSAPSPPRSPGKAAAALAGAAATAVVLGVAEFVAAVTNPAAAPFVAVGSTVVDRTPEPLREFAIEQFGTRDKQVLFLSMALVISALAIAIGLLERNRPWGSAALGLLGIAVGVVVLQRPGATATDVIPTVLGVAAGIVTLRVLIRRAPRSGAGRADLSRRRFLILTGGAAVVAAGAVATGQWLGQRLRAITADRAAFRLPTPQTTAAPPPPGTDPPVPGLTPFVTANDRFYRIDTALRIPAVTRDDWRLRIHGRVARTVELSMTDLEEFTAVEKMITLTCVSNEVGGDLAGNAVWTGYSLAELLSAAGVAPEADMLLSRSADGFTAGTPIAAITDGRDALLAVGMNGEPLPLEHGYPARLVVPGLYGFVSATKWVVDLEITRFDEATAYWTARGWAERAPIKVASRIDTPSAFATVAAGPTMVAGVAWAQQRGIAMVEVQVDDQPWAPARLVPEYSADTWRQWTWRWDAEPGRHTLRVRATDATGQRQTDQRVRPIPDGATGWHSLAVTVA